MLFNSFSFLLFFPVTTIGYFLIPHRYRWVWLLMASCFFYMSFVPGYILILAATIITDYIVGLGLKRNTEEKNKKLLLIIGILANVGVLAFFKYFNFFVENVNTLASIIHWNYSLSLLEILLPIGLSFHTFQSISYLVEVYRGNHPAEKHVGILATYIMFYPQLVAGPIERPQHLLHQFKEKHLFNYEQMVSGLKLMVIGFFKKMVIADRLAEFVNIIFADVHQYHSWQLLIGIVFFAFQIYYDFSGYTDIARGAARVMGFELMVNFKNPYRALSTSEFWQRWHISLSSWFRDYVYIPLGGNRVKKGRYFINIMTVFLLSGLWHGANWTYVVWGGLNGLYLIVAHTTEKIRRKIKDVLYPGNLKKIEKIIARSMTFSLICFAWIFFRAHSIDDALHVVHTIFTDGTLLKDLTHPTTLFKQFFGLHGTLNFLIVVFAVFVTETASGWAEKRNIAIEDGLRTAPWYLRWSVYYTLLASIIVLGVVSAPTFVYFQF